MGERECLKERKEGGLILENEEERKWKRMEE